MSSPGDAPRISRGQAAIAVVVGLAAAGAAIGALWSVLAPPVRGVIVLTRGGDKVLAYLDGEADHFFTSAFMMLGMLVTMAVVAAVLLWQWRAHRGPVIVGALALGCGIAAGLAGGVGTALMRWRYGSIDIEGAPVSPEHRVHHITEAPGVFFGSTPLQIATMVLFPAAIAALVYALAAVSTPRDDLGGWPPEYPLAVGKPGAIGQTGPIDQTGTGGDVLPVVPS